MTTRVAIGLGSNLGDRTRHLTEAGRAITERIGTLVASSSLWETAPVGGPTQGPYLNAVVVIETDLGAREVLDALLEIERAHGRLRRERWGPRPLDLDLLLYGDEEIDFPGLQVPHPRMTVRRFVLEPLREVWPEARLPSGELIADFLPTVADQEAGRVEQGLGAGASLALFLLVGFAAVGLWWLMDLFL